MQGAHAATLKHPGPQFFRRPIIPRNCGLGIGKLLDYHLGGQRALPHSTAPSAKKQTLFPLPLACVISYQTRKKIALSQAGAESVPVAMPSKKPAISPIDIWRTTQLGATTFERHNPAKPLSSFVSDCKLAKTECITFAALAASFDALLLIGGYKLFIEPNPSSISLIISGLLLDSRAPTSSDSILLFASFSLAVALITTASLQGKLFFNKLTTGSFFPAKLS